MYSTDVQDERDGTVSATDHERLPPGGFSLRHGFPGWFGRASSRSRQVSSGSSTSAAAASAQHFRLQQHASLGAVIQGTSPPQAGGGNGGSDVGGGESNSSVSGSASPTLVGSAGPSSAAASPAPSAVRGGESSVAGSSSYGFAQPASSARVKGREISTYEVLRYIRSAFDDEDVLDSIPLEAAGNPGAWHAWRTHRRQTARVGGQEGGENASKSTTTGSQSTAASATATRRPGEWNWEGVWEERSKRGIATSLSEAVLYGNAGTADEMVSV